MTASAQAILGHARIGTALEIYTDTDVQACREALAQLHGLPGGARRARTAGVIRQRAPGGRHADPPGTAGPKHSDAVRASPGSAERGGSSYPYRSPIIRFARRSLQSRQDSGWLA